MLPIDPRHLFDLLFNSSWMNQINGSFIYSLGKFHRFIESVEKWTFGYWVISGLAKTSILHLRCNLLLIVFFPCDCFRYVEEFTATAGRPEFRTKQVTDDQIIGNPLQAFQLIKRLTIDWNSVKSIMSDAAAWRSKYTCSWYTCLKSAFSLSKSSGGPMWAEPEYFGLTWPGDEWVSERKSFFLSLVSIIYSVPSVKWNSLTDTCFSPDHSFYFPCRSRSFVRRVFNFNA